MEVRRYVSEAISEEESGDKVSMFSKTKESWICGLLLVFLIVNSVAFIFLRELFKQYFTLLIVNQLIICLTCYYYTFATSEMMSEHVSENNEKDHLEILCPACSNFTNKKELLTKHLSAVYPAVSAHEDTSKDNVKKHFKSDMWKLEFSKQSPLKFEAASVKQLKSEKRSACTFFTWNIRSWKRYHDEIRLESSEFKDEFIEGISWRCLMQRQRSNRKEEKRWKIKLRLYNFDVEAYPEGRIFCEVVCFCEGSCKSTFGTFYPGCYEYIMNLDTANEEILQRRDIQVTCIITILREVSINVLPSLPPLSDFSEDGSYITSHTLKISWTLQDWRAFNWGPGVGVFSPLFCLVSLPEYIWQIQLFPQSDIDDGDSGTLMALFLKLVDTPVERRHESMEVDFELETPFHENFDTVRFCHGGTHGFRNYVNIDSDSCPEFLTIVANVNMNIPLFV